MLNQESATPRILLVDDNSDILIVAGTVLEEAGYVVWAAVSGQEALQIVERNGLPHLAIIDINMPGMDGFELSRRLQDIGNLPIIMLTAQSQESTIVAALEEFADDYITKPFISRELLARVERVLRRVEDFDYTINLTLQLDSQLKIDFSTREVVSGDVTVSLTPTEARILYLLIQKNGEFVHSQVLSKRLWPLGDGSEERLRVHISRLRQKLGALPGDREYIVVERGLGYRFQNQ